MPDIPANDEPNLAVLLEMVDAEMVRRLHEALDDAGHHAIRPAHGAVFEQIGRDGARITDMADRAGLTKQAMGYLVDHLEAHGYCRRVVDPDDRRAKIVTLTKKGWDAVDVAERSLRRTERAWAEELGVRRVQSLRSTLKLLAGWETGA